MVIKQWYREEVLVNPKTNKVSKKMVKIPSCDSKQALNENTVAYRTFQIPEAKLSNGKWLSGNEQNISVWTYIGIEHKIDSCPDNIKESLIKNKMSRCVEARGLLFMLTENDKVI